MSRLDDYLKSNDFLTYWNRGSSMLPLIRQNKDLFTIERKREGTTYKKYDVVLYRNKGKLILHRIIGVKGGGYTIMGDNTYRSEKGIKNDIIIGKMVSFERGGKCYYVTDPQYLLYVYLWWGIFPLRYMIHRLIFLMKKVVKAIS